MVENYKRYLERIDLYEDFGFDIEKERDFIIEKAQPIFGDILEVGTGKGYFTIALAKEGYSFISIDISKEEHEFVRSNLEYLGLDKQVNLKIENAENLSFDSGSFDVIFAINTIHHLKNPFKVIDELIRIVSFEGKIILSDFTKEGFELIVKIHAHEGRIHEANGTNLDEVGSYLMNKSFSVRRHKTKSQELLIAYHQVI